jgi:alpha/beta superfamily hydrolase
MSITPIELTTTDGVTLRGQTLTGGDDWVILLHDLGLDLDSWQPLLGPLQERGYSALAVDFRGHGASDGEWTPAGAVRDAEAMLAYVAAKQPHRIFAAATGFAGVALLKTQSDVKPKALALLSPRPSADELASEALRGPGIAKVFLVGAHDEPARECAVQMRNRSIGWAMVVNLPTTENSTHLLWSKWQRHVIEHILSFFHEQRHDTSTMPARGAPNMDSVLGRDSEK